MGSRGLLGGILTFWEENVYHMINYEINESWVGVTLRLLKGNIDFVIVNVYSPQALQEQKKLWKSLSQVLEYCESHKLPVTFIADFNCTRFLNDSATINSNSIQGSRVYFNRWLTENNLLEIQLKNTLYTWMGSQGEEVEYIGPFILIHYFRSLNGHSKHCIRVIQITNLFRWQRKISIGVPSLSEYSKS